MTCELMLLRHGKSDWSTATSDFERPLAKRGKRDAKMVGIWLLQKGLRPDYIISSPARRALDTARRAVKRMGMDIDEIIRDGRVYDADLSDLMAGLRDHSDSMKRILLVGHNPGLEELVEYMADERVEIPVDGKLMPTATLARLVLPGDWSGLSAGCAQLKSITRPSNMQT